MLKTWFLSVFFYPLSKYWYFFFKFCLYFFQPQYGSHLKVVLFYNFRKTLKSSIIGPFFVESRRIVVRLNENLNLTRKLAVSKFLQPAYYKIKDICYTTFKTLSLYYRHAATLQKRAERDGFFLTTQGIIQLVQRYRNGIRGRMKSAVHELLRQYYEVESQFQQG